MTREMSMDELADYFADQIREIERLEAEIEEVQAGFNTRFVELQAQHDEQLVALTDQVLAHYEEIAPALRERIEDRRITEREALEKRRDALRDEEIPALQKEADQKQLDAQVAERALRKSNATWDRKEEQAKSRLKDLIRELESLNAEIRRWGKGLGFITHYIRISKLDRRRNQVIGEITATRRQLEDIREAWEELSVEKAGEMERMKEEWRDLSVKIAKWQAELDYLDDPEQLEALALRRSVTGVLDEMTDPGEYETEMLHDEIQKMIRLNIQTDNYQKGLGAVAGVIALLRGIANGFQSFRSSVEAIASEQKMHQAYLPRLTFPLPRVAERFNAQWGPLRERVKDEKRLSRYPLEFVAAIDPALKNGLSTSSIQKLFAALGSELDRATANWRG